VTELTPVSARYSGALSPEQQRPSAPVMIGDPYGLLLTRVLKAKRFQVIDRQGQTRATLGVESDGEPALILYEKDGKVIWQASEPLSVSPDSTLKS
jgi:hypothetical protein